MGIYLNPEPARFHKSRNSAIYVDKSGLIAHTNTVLDTEQQYVCVSRPRRFGKSMAADMLAAYYCRTNNAQKDFAGLKIASDPSFAEHANKYDVIRVEMQRFISRAGGDIAVALQNLEKALLADLQEEYPEYVLPDADFIDTLSRVYTRTGRPFVIIIDEWDSPFRLTHFSASCELYINFLRDLLKDQPYVALAYITGILPRTREELWRCNFNEYFEFYTMTDDGRLGFLPTEEELAAAGENNVTIIPHPLRQRHQSSPMRD